MGAEEQCPGGVEWMYLIREEGVAAANTPNEHSRRPPHLPRHETTARGGVGVPSKWVSSSDVQEWAAAAAAVVVECCMFLLCCFRRWFNFPESLCYFFFPRVYLSYRTQNYHMQRGVLLLRQCVFLWLVFGNFPGCFSVDYNFLLCFFPYNYMSNSAHNCCKRKVLWYYSNVFSLVDMVGR